MSKQKAFGRRAVGELLNSELEVLELFFLSSGTGKEFFELIRIAEERKIRAVRVSRQELDRIAGADKHQGVIAFYTAPPTMDLEDLLDRRGGDESGPIIILDGVEDPHNLGAIIRSAEVFGALGVVIRQRRAAGLNPVVVKASAGGALRLPIVVAVNIERTIRTLQQEGYWVYGLDMGGSKTIWETNLSGNIALVLGSEGHGLGQLVRERCDDLISILQTGTVSSLNVSVSAGIVLAEWMRQQRI